MKERPILFSAPMVRAILSGSKTQTRRKIKPQPDPRETEFWHNELGWFGAAPGNGDGKPPTRGNYFKCPYGAPGDLLWVRETWVEVLAVSPATDGPVNVCEGDRLIEEPTYEDLGDGRKRWRYDGRIICYRATSNIEFCDGDGFTGPDANKDDMPRWRPSIHMPRWASRILLRVTEVRVERLQDISDEDVYREGLTVCPGGWTLPEWDHYFETAREAYAELWDSINGKGSWNEDPWVWVVSFERVPTDAEGGEG